MPARLRVGLEPARYLIAAESAFAGCVRPAQRRALVALKRLERSPIPKEVGSKALVGLPALPEDGPIARNYG